MIPLKFGLFYSGAPLSYLRYLTFKSLRHFHPDSKIELYTTKNYNVSSHNWSSECQDFEKPALIATNYMEKLKDIGVDIIMLDNFGSANYHPVYQSDLFRWWWLKNNGGFYLDTDQIILRSFQTLPLDSEFIYSSFFNPDCGTYAPVGVLGLEKDSKIADHIMKVVPRHYNPNNYNSSGPFMLIKELSKLNLTRSINVPSLCFYPIARSADVCKIYDGSFEIPNISTALHWYGGHPLSQSFNNKYTEELAITSNDAISRFVRENKII